MFRHGACPSFCWEFWWKTCRKLPEQATKKKSISLHLSTHHMPPLLFSSWHRSLIILAIDLCYIKVSMQLQNVRLNQTTRTAKYVWLKLSRHIYSTVNAERLSLNTLLFITNTLLELSNKNCWKFDLRSVNRTNKRW